MGKKSTLQQNVIIFLDTKETKYFNKIYDELNFYLYRLIKSIAKKEDLTNEILSIAFENIYTGLITGKYKVQKKASFKTWASSVAINAARWYLREHNKYNKNYMNEFNTTNLLRNSDEQYNVAIDVELQKLYESIISYIKKIKNEDIRKIAVKAIIEKKKYKEIAEELNKTEDHIKYKMLLIKNEIRSKFEANYLTINEYENV